METKEFKTTIKCGGCVATVTPVLNNLAGEHNWSVDLQSADKTLVVTSEHPADEITRALRGVGYEATAK
jgi:copper chaperone